MTTDEPRTATQAKPDGDCRVNGWQRADVLLELHTGEPAQLAPHSHGSYQIGVATREPTEYLCRGRSWLAHRGSIVIFPPDEVHAVVRTAPRRAGDRSRIMYVEPARMLEAARAVNGPAAVLPHFSDLIVRDASFIQQFTKVHDACAADTAGRDTDTTVQLLLVGLIRGFAAPCKQDAPAKRQHAMALRARDFIVSHFRDSISLAQLADVAHCSPYHLNRVFTRHVGMPPHAFQNQIRVERSKAMLLQGTPLAEIAELTGFFDQSHFTRYFRRIVGVTPSSYALPLR